MLAFWWTAGIRTLGIGQHGGTTFTRGVQGLSDIYRGKRGYKRPKSPQKLICTPAYVWLSMSTPVSPCCVKARFPNEKGVVGFELSYENIEEIRFCTPFCTPERPLIPPFSVPYRLNFQPIDAHSTQRQGAALCWRCARSGKAMPKPGGPLHSSGLRGQGQHQQHLGRTGAV